MPKTLLKPDPIRLRIESDPANLKPARQTVEDYALSAGFSREDVDELGLVVNEAIANVIRHAYAGATDRPIEVTASIEGDQSDELHVGIRDWGSGVDPSCLIPKEKDPLVPGGLGLICMEKMMDECHFVSQPDGMLLKMMKRK